MDLNEPQLTAALHARGPLLVFAGAGSGKTRVITVRIANLVAREQVPPYRILAVTFTNKAAGEMRERLAGMLGPAASDLWVGTFHSTAAKLLRTHGAPVGLSRNFVIYDSSDQRALLTRIVRDEKLDEKRYQPRAMLSRILKEKQEGRGPDEMAIDSYVDEAVQKLYGLYDKRLREANAVDFEDLILLSVKLVESDTPEGRALRGKFDYVLVDEFQDTNRMQYAFLRAMVSQSGNLCVVGDDDQSIYRWRGADVRNIRGFRSDFPGANVVKLEQNYRSTRRIVASALAVIAPSRVREPKELWTDNEEGDKLRVIAVADERDEAAVVVDMVRTARGEGTPLSEIAVFYRVHAQSRVLEEALRAAALPYQIVGGMKFFDRAEVKDALSYLRLLVNPQSDVDFLRVVNQPARGIGETTLDRVAALAGREGVSMYDALDLIERGVGEEPRETSLRRAEAAQSEPLSTGDAELDALFGQTRDLFAARETAHASSGKPKSKRAARGEGELASAAKKRLGQFRALIETLRHDSRSMAPVEVLDLVMARSGYQQALQADTTAEAEARLENLGELRGSLVDYEASARAAGEEPSLEGFLERVSLVADVDTLENEGRVTLMTVHGAKGLEFECVAMTGMEEDLFPYRGMGNTGGFDEEELDEERRLAYVAITRARKNLTITHAGARQIFGQTRYGTPSRFLRELPAEHVEELATAAGAQRERYVDRSDWSRGQSGGYDDGWTSSASRSVRREVAREPGERYVDREFFDDGASEVSEPARAPRMPAKAQGAGLRIGQTVQHTRFGEGVVRQVVQLGEPAVVAFFPGWGEMKVLARFLQSV